MRQLNIALGVVLCSFSGSAALAQNLVAPADPLKAIEGEWTGLRDENRIRVENGKVTLIHADPKKSWQKFQSGMVVGHLNDGGKSINGGRGHTFSTSQCLVAYDHGHGPQFKMEPCGERGASLATFVNEYHFYISGMGFKIPKNKAR